MPTHEDYLLGTDDVESVRLAIQHRLWAESAAAAWERAGIVPGSRVLDVGCGPGYAAMDLAQLVGPRGRVLGVEGSPAYTAQFNESARLRGFEHASAIQGDVHTLTDALGDELATFDVAYARWVFCFSQTPARLAEQMHGALRPGGRVAIQDYFGYQAIKLAPRSDAFQRGIRAIVESWEGTGASLDVMGDMPTLLRAAGFELTHFRVIQRLARSTEQMWTWPSIFWHSYIPRVVAGGHLTQPEADAFMNAWEQASNNPDAFLLLPPVFEAVAIKH